MNNIKYYAVKEQCDCLKRGIEKLLFEMFDRGVLKDYENTLQNLHGNRTADIRSLEKEMGAI